MNDRIKRLADLGCDVEDAMERFLDDEDFYMECLEQVLYDPQFQRLQTALENHQLQEGFDCAHTLKGLAANLGLTSLASMASRITEPLREGKEADFMRLYQDLQSEREKYIAIITN